MPLRKSRLYFVALLLFVLQQASAQGTSDHQLAAHYFQSGEFEKAALYYERLYDKDPNQNNYEHFLKCLLALEDYNEAGKLARKQAKMFDHPRYQVDVGKVYKLSGDPKKAQDVFSSVVKGLESKNVGDYIELGNAFIELNETDWALEVYYKGRKNIGKGYPFNFQIAQVLGMKGETRAMVAEYLDVIDENPGYLQSVQNTLNRVIGFEAENKYNDVLREELMLRVQKNPDNDLYAEMLIWMFMKQKNYNAALQQAKAIDKRNREDGARVLSLGKIALGNMEYAVAEQAFDYVQQKGPSNRYYLESVTSLLRTLQVRITNGTYTLEDLQKLDNRYNDMLDVVGINAASVPIIRDQANLKAFYLAKYNPAKVQEAISSLEAALDIPGQAPHSLASTKLKLADIYVVDNNIWEASLLYGQVEKDFKYDELGQEAKLKNAMVYYYAGDFAWAQAQLDVLKGSTSKLIANDAMELSLFITDNTGLDTSETALKMFSKADLQVKQHNYDSALAVLSLIARNFPATQLADDLHFKRYQVFLEQQEYEKAVAELERIIQDYSTDILYDNALFALAELYQNQLGEASKAMEYYQRILTDQPGSLYVVESRKRFRALRGDQVN